MRKLVTIFVMVVLVVSSPAWAIVSFTHPPETNPNITWVTQSPYQRNIMMNFNVTPVGPAGPGIPGADYEGLNDPVLKVSDYVTMTGAFKWDAITGAIGIFKGGSGTVTIHIDNSDYPYGFKDFYLECLWTTVSPGAGFTYTKVVKTSDGVSHSPDWQLTELISAGHNRVTAYNHFSPNPQWEEMIITFSNVASNGSVYIDNLHVATECIPEPATVCLLVLGALGLMRKRRA